jgi:hypothetical protein
MTVFSGRVNEVPHYRHPDGVAAWHFVRRGVHLKTGGWPGWMAFQESEFE